MREWLVDLVGEGMAPIATYVLAAAIVLILVLLVVWIARKALGGSIGPRAKGRGPRLAVMDVAAIDPKRKLVLVRRDEVEHLLLIGGQNDIVVEASILRVPASARAQRTEPTMRPSELDAVPERPQQANPLSAPPAPAPAQAQAPAAIQPPSRAAMPPMPPQRLAPGAGQRPPEPRPASPLARSVPRQPMPAPAQQAPAPQAPTQQPTAVRQQPPQDAAPTAPAVAVAQPQTPSGRSVEATPVEPRREIPLPAVEQTEKEARAGGQLTSDTPAPERREPQFPEMHDQVEAPETEAPPAPVPVAVMPPIVPPQREPSLQREAPAVPRIESPMAAPTAPGAMQPSPAPSGAPRVEPERRGGPSPEGNRQDPPVERPAAAIRAPEPVRRPMPQQTVQPIQPRSMATPTYRAASPFLGLGDGEARPAAPQDAAPRAEPRVAPPENRVSLSSTAPGMSDPASIPAQNRAPGQQPAFPQSPATAGNDSLSGLLGLRPTAPSSPIIAAAERQREALRPRQAPMIDTPPPAEPVEPVEDAAEKRPLSVRSFATAIQSMKPSAEPQPPQPTPAQAAPSLAPQRRDPELKPPLPVFVAPAVGAVAPAVMARSEAPKADDSGSNLDDFLSAELDSDFGNVSWDDEPAPAKAPDVRIEAPNAPEVASEPPRVLSLEEEMERLLGDFDFDTSDRRAQ